MEEAVPLVLRHDSEHDFEMSEREYLLGSRSEELIMSGSSRPSRRQAFCEFCTAALRCCFRRRELKERIIRVGYTYEDFPPNVIRNQKYNILTFLPLVLFEQFKFFLNLYFLVMACTQFIPDIRVGYLYTYWGPLGFVLTVTIFREAVDDLRRHRRDKEVNGEKYLRLTILGSWEPTPSSKLKVGDIIRLEKNQRVPADLVLLRTSESTGQVFIRTDQLDGETDWKLRVAVPPTQALGSDSKLTTIQAEIYVEKPHRDIHTFVGKFSGTKHFSLNIENTLWGNTVIANGSAVGVVVYTGCETRSVINNSQPRSKRGLFDLEINNITKVLFFAVIGLALVMMGLKGFSGPWYRYLFRFILLFSYIIPLSLRVNLDMSKSFYSFKMQKDPEIPGTVVRSSTIPEELGRISYLLTDKTGTLTQNEMVFKKLDLGRVSYGTDSFEEVKCLVSKTYGAFIDGDEVGRLAQQLKIAVEALALCHNVTPCSDNVPEDENASATETDEFYRQRPVDSDTGEIEADIASANNDPEADPNASGMSYQAASPDEIALVKWTEQMGVTLWQRDMTEMQLKTPAGVETFNILQTFPFTSELKRMGIIVRKAKTGEITFFLKGADVVMIPIVTHNDCLKENCDSLAALGLRTLVVAKKSLTLEQYLEWETRYNSAILDTTDRSALVQAAVESLERDMELVCLTGVEDKLQEGVRPTLESLRHAGIKIWMLTGDKMETAQCIAKSSCLVARNQKVHVFKSVETRNEAHLELNSFRRTQDTCLIITGESLEVCLKFYPDELMELACRSPTVVCCRCSPTQKAQVVRLIQKHTGKRTAAVGDGGNDVSMIQTADAGVGIAGREGLQASLAADFSIQQFNHLSRLLLVHGRNSYKRSCALSQFIIHRGLIISAMQAIFSAVFYFSSVALYQGFLVVGYATVYTMFPVFSLVYDVDVTPKIALTYPELYKDLAKGRSMSYKTFFIWVLISIYQGAVIMYGAFILFDRDFIHIVAISFTALVLTELLMVALTVHTWHRYMVVAEIVSLSIYCLSLVIFKDSFDPEFIFTTSFLWKVVVITLVSCLPLYILKFLRKKFAPSDYSKLS